ncbi:MAG: OmpA family protein, partial [Cyanobacteria bacterium SZAS-4]|nr:OmpA family protein [Cyanobacteria bacterium SZAS-4]
GHQVEVDGHTDSIGDDAYNQDLSEKRAATVKSWLVEHAFVQAGDVSAKGFGETCPVARNTYTDGTDYPQGRQKNRRVEICVSAIAVEKAETNSGL